MRCPCLQCELAAALELLRAGKMAMGTLLVEQVLEAMREHVERSKAKAPRARKTKARARA